MKGKLLSKTNYLNGLQCPKYLWMIFHEPEKIPETDKATQYIFDQGHFVGELAKHLFPGGIDVPTDNFAENIRQTRALAEKRVTLFEAGISSGNLFARVDMLEPAGNDRWNLIEVKSTTGVKDIHLHDVAFQKYCCEQAGFAINKCFLTHINNEYVRYGEINPEQLFVTEDITAQVKLASEGIQGRVDAMFEIISAKQAPHIMIGTQCRDPYDCPITECWAFLPEGSVFDLYRGGKKCFELFERGVLALKDIPDDYRLTSTQQIQKVCEDTGHAYLNKEGIMNFLSTMQYPLHYLDFETFSPAVPMFDGTRPYQAIPFQFSMHIAKDEESDPEHFSFIASGTSDPRPAFLIELKNVLGDTGSIIVYNQGFEEGILKDLVGAFPEYESWTRQVSNRFVDLLLPFRRFYYYHPLQKGSASLKNVLPRLTGKSYEGMDINNGEAASVAFQEVTYGDVPDEVSSKVRADLEAYCMLDTEGMIWIVDSLRNKLKE